jgi:hypothetical protein
VQQRCVSPGSCAATCRAAALLSLQILPFGWNPGLRFALNDCFPQEECIVMDDDTKNTGNKNTDTKDHGRDPRYLDLIATILLLRWLLR